MKNAILPVTLDAAGGTVTLAVSQPYTQVQVYSTGNVTLASNFVITTSGSPTEGREYTIYITLGGTLDLNGNAFTLFSRNMDADMLTNTTGGMLVVHAKYINAAWKVTMQPNMMASGFIESSHIKDATITSGDIADNAVTYTKIQDFSTRGNLLRGGAAGAPEEFAAVTAGNLVMGNGTDVVSQAMSGDVTISSTGVTTIGASKITTSMLNFTLSSYLEASLSITSAQILALNTTPLTIVAAPGAGKYIEVVSATIDMTYSTAAYATNTTLQLIHESANIAVLQNTSALIATTNKVVTFVDPTAATAGQTQIIKNSALQVKVATGDPTAGSGTMVVRLTYRIVG